MVAVRGCVSLAVAFLFLLCSVFFLECRVAGVVLVCVGVCLRCLCARVSERGCRVSRGAGCWLVSGFVL